MHHHNNNNNNYKYKYKYYYYFIAELAAEYAGTRKQFTRKLAEFGMIQVCWSLSL